ncbi:MAG: aconitase X swivel domain-containing protein [Nitrososphaerales archaeon]
MNQIKTIRCIVEGNTSGEVLYSSEPIAFLQGVDPERGFVSDPKHEIFGQSFSKKVLVFPNSVGSSVGAYVIYRLKKNGKAPRAIINQKTDIITASGCALAGIPLFDLLGADITELRDLKQVKVNGKHSSLTITND